jgi:hypothetical protein
VALFLKDFSAGDTPAWSPFAQNGDCSKKNGGAEKPADEVSAEGGAASASEESLPKQNIPPELRGVSVKDLAREISKLWFEISTSWLNSLICSLS